MSTPQPPRIESGRDLLLKDLGKLLTVEETLAKMALPKLQQEVQDEQLKAAVSEHLAQTRGHVEQVKSIFETLGEKPAGQEAAGLDGLKTERESVVAELAPALRDGFNASAAMGTEHYEIASYEAAIRLADAEGLAEVSATLRGILDEEVAALQKLGDHATRLAQARAEQPAV